MEHLFGLVKFIGFQKIDIKNQYIKFYKISMETPQIMSTDFDLCLNKFILTIKDEFIERFNDFMKNNKDNINNNKEIEMVEKKPDDIILKKGPGRPKKIIESETERLLTDEIEIQPKKKRGRPRKIKEDINTSVIDTDDDVVTNNIPLKKKGRPALKDQHNIIEVNTDKEPVCDIQEIDVIRIDINGEIYLRDTHNNLYNMSDQESVGKYDETNNAIIV
jgi:hypothetical protein